MSYSEFLKNQNQENLNAKARTAFNKLKLELGCRSDNEHVGSGMGGNVSEYLFLLTHTVEVVGTKEGNPSFSKVTSNEVSFYSAPKPPMKLVRQALTSFLDKEFPDRTIVTQDQIINLSFMKDIYSTNVESDLFIRALEQTYDLVKWLDLKLDMQKKMQELGSQEREDISFRFLKEMNLPKTYFQDHKDDKQDPMGRMLSKHPVWGVKQKAVNARIGEICKQLLSTEDNEKLQMIGCYPAYITLFVFRSLVNIERIVALNLDENINCKFLSDINREMEDKNKDEDENEDDND